MIVDDGKCRAWARTLPPQWNLFELTHPDFPGERIVACPNPELTGLGRPAKRSPVALAKTTHRVLDDGSSVHSLCTLLEVMATIIRNRCVTLGAGDAPTFIVNPSLSPAQRRVIEQIDRRSLSTEGCNPLFPAPLSSLDTSEQRQGELQPRHDADPCQSTTPGIVSCLWQDGEFA